MNNVILNIFDVESEAFQSFNELKNFKQTENTKIAQIALVQNVEGRITVKDFYDFVDSANEEAFEGTLIGALIGIIGGPLGMLFGASLGGLEGLTIGTSVDTTEASLVQYIANKLSPNETAIIALVEEKDEKVINALFSKYKTQIIRWEAERVADDIVAAIKVQENLYHQAQVELKAERKKERTQKVQEFKDRIKKEFATLKSKIKV